MVLAKRKKSFTQRETEKEREEDIERNREETAISSSKQAQEIMVRQF